MTEIRLRRAYEPQTAGEGYRVYVDKLWPRGLSHETFRYDAWEKDIAPSDGLRHWFHEDRDANWPEFEEKYRAELAANPAVPSFVGMLKQHPAVTLLYSSKNEEENNALVLADWLASAYKNDFTLAQS